jgi:ATP-binding protein involved in chromosome partitioning
MIDKAIIQRTLEQCFDPELKIDIVSLGLIQSIDLDDHHISVGIIFTSPSCPFADQISQDIITRLKALAPSHEIKVNQRLEPAWDPSKLSPRAKRKLLISS